jgi:dihydrolipoamide dehydrogenase
MDYDLIIIGSGPGGYAAAIRASQLKMEVAVIEKSELGGVCLNWGCIPTKSLLKSAQVLSYIRHASDYGVSLEGEIKADFGAIIARSRSVAEKMSKGVQFLFRKNGITHIQGFGRLSGSNSVEVEDHNGKKSSYTAKNIILATGAKAKDIPAISRMD